MSQETDTESYRALTPSSDSNSPSLLNNLRRFRINKKPSLKFNMSYEDIDTALLLSDDVEENSILDSPTGYSRNTDSNPYEESSTKGVFRRDSSLTHSEDTQEIIDKEAKVKFLEDAFPSVDRMLLQDTLVEFDWDVNKAMRDLLGESIMTDNIEEEATTPPAPQIVVLDDESDQEQKRKAKSPVQHHRKKVRRMDSINEDGDDEDTNYGNNPFKDNQVIKVFDSDESEEELTVRHELTQDQKHVLKFLSSATLKELLSMPSCSRKKADAIIGVRPFTSWQDMVDKFQNGKFLNTEILNSAQEVLRARNVVCKLMNKCKRLSHQIKHAVAANETSVKNQPSLLSSDTSYYPFRLHLAGYQLVGLNWLLIMHSQQVNSILADEMGLGKTIQVIAFLAHLFETGIKGPHLIVVPASTLKRKILRVSWMIHDGLKEVDVILTTYSLVCSTPEERKMFRILHLVYVVLDEAHMLKNMATQRYESLIKIGAKHRILLTGTPLQNNLLELMSLLIFIMPELFEGKKEYLKSLFSKLPKQNNENDDLPKFEKDQVSKAREIMKPFILRRLKKEVLQDLPTKKDETISVPLAPLQRQRYNDLIRIYSNKDKESFEEQGLSGVGIVTELRKAANHSALLRYHYTDEQLTQIANKLAKERLYKETNQQYIHEDLCVMSDFHIHSLTCNYKCLSKYHLPESVILESGKFLKLDEMLPALKRDGHRVLIFSQFVIMLEILEAYLTIRGHLYLRLDGNTPVTTRQDLIDEFNNNSDLFVFLLSTRAGGLGINLTAADTVIIHDIDFNPYNDKQAEDRCHRVGQTRDVSVFRLISKDTIEESIHQVALEKLQLEQDISNPRENDETEARHVVTLLKRALGLEAKKTDDLDVKKTEVSVPS
uniref:SWI/SNF-related matrix-associated actin-dependent regulator of chromatin subfamily A containing DEAD/H box 1 n=1 Tax=Timema monikensis TaxID=170555 RepID=A0A7R9E211_9NEOP|nr:unnamed protein product [Timema monikensis]